MIMNMNTHTEELTNRGKIPNKKSNKNADEYKKKYVCCLFLFYFSLLISHKYI